MKKLIFASIFALGTLTAVQAQTPTEDKEPTAMNETTLENPAVVNALSADQNFKEIKSSDVPQKVLTSVNDKYKSAEISKAYTNDKQQYKLVIAVADSKGQKGKQQTVYLSANGDWIKAE